MTRRVLNIGAVINDAELIIADEPTPGLSEDQAEQLMKDFRSIASDGCGILLITHDINLAIEHADKIAVFYAGTTLETAPASDFRDGENLLRHPYSKALWRALPQNGFHSTPGIQPYAGTVKTGCVYAARCPLFSGRAPSSRRPMSLSVITSGCSRRTRWKDRSLWFVISG